MVLSNTFCGFVFQLSILIAEVPATMKKFKKFSKCIFLYVTVRPSRQPGASALYHSVFTLPPPNT